MTKPIACIGAANIDRKARCVHAPVLGSSNPVETVERFGGVARSVCENLARLDCPAGLLAPLARDKASERISAFMTDLGVKLAPIDPLEDHPTATYTALVDQDGELVVGNAEMQIAESLSSDMIDAAWDFLSDYPLWFLDANLPEPVLRHVAVDRPKGVTLAVDGVSVAKVTRFAKLLGEIDILFCNAGEAAALTGAEIRAPLDLITAAHLLRDKGIGTVVLSWGADGCYVAGDGLDAFVPAYPTKVKDVTGAGDALTAGTLFGLSTGMPIDASVRHGLAAASLACATDSTVNSDISTERLMGIIDNG